MRSVSERAVTGLVYVCVFFAVITVSLGVIGAIGVSSTTDVGNSIVADELATATATAQTARAMDAVYSGAEQVLLDPDPAHNPAVAALYNQQLPAAEAQLGTLLKLHADDSAAERADVEQLAAQWAAVRTVVNPEAIATLTGPSYGLAASLRTSYAPVSAHLAQLLVREDSDAQDGRAHARTTKTRTLWMIGLAVGFAEIVTLVVCRIGSRRIRRSAEPEEDQVEFAETLQLAKNEDEAHELLQRHLERIIPDTSATVLNRNNSADRLEAVTALPPGSPLLLSLPHAEPQSCLAVRSGRRNDQGGKRRLLACAVCGDCPGTSTCTPLTVSGEVIGSVLVNRLSPCSTDEKQRISDSVIQAAPVLANLRNLAIAELRAATDSLTGLPNKRAVGDTLKRMVAQASRSLSPVALILIDLDHFKDINDRLGHPVGDQALASVGAALKSVVRESDFAGRNGGEEFAVLLPDTDSIGALQTAEKIRQAIAEIGLPSTDMAMSASLGVAVYPEHATSADRLERLADAALYTAKRSGRNRTEIATLTPETVS